jgi:hypothetical protein
MTQQIPGVPEGWEAVSFDYVSDGECWLDKDGDPIQHTSSVRTQCKRLIIRKIEKPAKYRPFADAEEFKPHRDRWVQYTSPSVGDCSAYRVSAYTSERVWLGPDNLGKEYKVAFHCLSFDDDGTPFGVRINE